MFVLLRRRSSYLCFSLYVFLPFIYTKKTATSSLISSCHPCPVLTQSALVSSSCSYFLVLLVLLCSRFRYADISLASRARLNENTFSWYSESKTWIQTWFEYNYVELYGFGFHRRIAHLLTFEKNAKLNASAVSSTDWIVDTRICKLPNT